jgi:hypothetical protein
MDEQKFIKGFNSGYLLYEHSPGIIKKLLTTVEPGNDYLNGMQSGAKEYEQEKSKIEPPNLNKNNLDKNHDHDLEIEKE